MWSLETLDYLNQQAAKRAKYDDAIPLVPDGPDAVDEWPPFPFPCLYNYVPDGWEQTEDVWFVDSIGRGRDDEPALSVNQFKRVLRRYIEAHPGYGFGLVEFGEFQAYVASYRPEGGEDS